MSTCFIATTAPSIYLSSIGNQLVDHDRWFADPYIRSSVYLDKFGGFGRL